MDIHIQGQGSENESTEDEDEFCSADEGGSSTESEDVHFTSDEIKADLIKEFNILLMSETGAGKSTFVNALSNYVKFKDFNDAKENLLQFRIPFSFTVFDKNFKKTTIRWGKDDNENMQPGESNTQRCKPHKLEYLNKQIQIFDTPGVGDTRGLNNDFKQLDETLEFLSEYNDVHAICIVLKPNEARVTNNFKYCLQQILSQLNKSAVDNIVFVFTHTSGTSFTPGETLTSLQVILEGLKLPEAHIIKLEKKNIFCLDNEGFRCLAACKQGVKMKRYDMEKSRNSWNHSSKECRRLLRYVTKGNDGYGLTPHKLNDTVSIYKARKTIKALYQPIMTTTKVADQNAELLKQRIEELKKCKDRKELEGILCTPMVQLKPKKLLIPRMVCTSENCTQYYKSNETLNQKICCDICECYEKTVIEIKTDKNEVLLNCKSFNKSSRNCTRCGCSYVYHQRVCEETEETYEEKLYNQSEFKENIFKDAQNLIKDLIILQDKYKLDSFNLKKYWIMLADFLKHNAIIVENNASEEQSLKQEIVASNHNRQSTFNSSKTKISVKEPCFEKQVKHVNAATKNDYNKVQLEEQIDGDVSNSSSSSIENKSDDKVCQILICPEDVIIIIKKLETLEVTKEIFKIAISEVVENANQIADQNSGWMKIIRDFMEKMFKINTSKVEEVKKIN